jgi:hypothetical protein
MEPGGGLDGIAANLSLPAIVGAAASWIFNVAWFGRS